jgi:hypothetical protein
MSLAQDAPGAPRQFPCSSCGAALEMLPGSTSLVCPYCGAAQTVAATGLVTEDKHDFPGYLQGNPPEVAGLPPYTTVCRGCAATTTTTDLSTRCASCNAPIVTLDDLGGRLWLPDAVVPFAIDKAAALSSFRAWTRSRWFAPNDLKKVVRTDRLRGGFVPHWGFDDDTTSDYVGQRGEYHYVTETYTVTVNGRPETRTRQVRHTRWYPASGRVARQFDDVLAEASRLVPDDDLEKLGPWTVAAATPCSPELLTGLSTPRYDIDAVTVWSDAKQQMAEIIEQDCRRDIGGDEQRVHQVTTYDDNVLFRLLLLPLWFATYVLAGQTYHVYINANTGKVIGDRPYSKVKIAAAVLAVLAVAAAGYLLYEGR